MPRDFAVDSVPAMTSSVPSSEEISLSPGGLGYLEARREY
jgi:hypothetical protein